MQDKFHVHDVDYFVLGLAHDSENLADMVLFTDSRDVFDKKDDVLGLSHVYVCPKKFFENVFVRGQYADFADSYKEESMVLGKYKHYKGNFYEAIGLGFHILSSHNMVIYKALYDHEKFGKNSVWIRPRQMFLEDVDIPDLGYKGPRFTLVNTQ